MADTKQKTQTFTLPEGRIINSSLFEMDAFVDAKGKAAEPSYKIELAFDPKQVTGEGTIEDDVLNAVCGEWGDSKEIEDEFFNGKIVSPFIDGNKLAADREARGKQGDAYKGKIIIRANTIYNFNGDKGAGGVWVVDENAVQVTAANRGAIYNGCYALVAVTISPYLVKGERGVKFYLSGVQKVRDGDKLTSADKSTLFKPVGRPAGAAPAGGRRSRAG